MVVRIQSDVWGVVIHTPRFPQDKTTIKLMR